MLKEEYEGGVYVEQNMIAGVVDGRYNGPGVGWVVIVWQEELVPSTGHQITVSWCRPSTISTGKH